MIKTIQCDGLEHYAKRNGYSIYELDEYTYNEMRQIIEKDEQRYYNEQAKIAEDIIKKDKLRR